MDDVLQESLGCCECGGVFLYSDYEVLPGFNIRSLKCGSCGFNKPLLESNGVIYKIIYMLKDNRGELWTVIADKIKDIIKAWFPGAIKQHTINAQIEAYHNVLILASGTSHKAYAEERIAALKAQLEAK